MATQAVEGSIAPTGDVVDFVIEIDNPEGFITPFGGVTTIVDSTTGVELGGTITPTGDLTVVSPTACFPTSYTCVESNAVDYECVGSCDTDTPINPEELLLGGIIIPVGQLVGDLCAPPVECPPIVVSDCDDVLRIAQDKLIAWHTARCGVLTSSGGEIGVAFSESFEYANIAAMEANGWVKTQTYSNPTKCGWLFSTGFVTDGAQSLMANLIGNPGTGFSRYRKTLSLTPSSNYDLHADVYQNTKHWYENATGITVQNFYGSSAAAHYQSPAGIFKELIAKGVSDGFGSLYVEVHVGVTSLAMHANFDNLRLIGIVPDQLAQWSDVSGNENHLTWVAGDRPTQTGPTVSGTLSILFNNAYLVWPTTLFLGIEDLEAIIVIKSTSGSGLWRIGADSADPTLFPSLGGNIIDNATSRLAVDFGTAVIDPTADFALYDIYGDASEVLAFLGTTLQGSSSHTFDYSSSPEFGRSDASTPGNFAVLEVVLTKKLTDDERSLCLASISARWGLA